MTHLRFAPTMTQPSRYPCLPLLGHRYFLLIVQIHFIRIPVHYLLSLNNRGSNSRGTAELLVGIEGWRKIRKALILFGHTTKHLLVFFFKELKNKMQNEHFHSSFYYVEAQPPPKHEKITQISPQTQKMMW